ncbi:hypothetical protein [Tsukamurella sp. 1534]|uniref:hypothetical protein n=1 Tax=Tsukamurella sp. 1534 TaxID=1151061 RepID=UPI00030FF1B9|nr:hypothetical protein [Tsukamurella sp. 1534]
MYPYAPPVPRLYRALALVQAMIAALTLLGAVIYWMANASYEGSADAYRGTYTDFIGVYLLAPLAVMLVIALVALVGLAVFVARGSLGARVASCCVWAVLMAVGLVAVQVHPAYVLVLFVALCMLLALALADRLSVGRGAPTVPPPPGGTVGPGGFPAGRFPAEPPAQGHDTGSFPQQPSGS